MSEGAADQWHVRRKTIGAAVAYAFLLYILVVGIWTGVRPAAPIVSVPGKVRPGRAQQVSLL